MRLGFPYYPFIPKAPLMRQCRYKNSSGNHYVPAQALPVSQTVHENIKEPAQKAPFLDIFGLQLEFDDFLILGLLLFLFMEGVDDQMLYIILFMLLLS